MKKLLSLALAMIMVLAALTTIFTINGFAIGDEEDEGVITPDTSWYNESATEYELTDAADLFGFIRLLDGQRAEDGTVEVEPITFEGKTVKLAANIDVNPGWNAAKYYADITATGEGADMIVPEVPVNNWLLKSGTTNTYSVFKGTLDGQNHYISGIYWTGSSRNGGLFGRVSGGTATIKNIAFVNSYVLLKEWRQGAIIGCVYSGSVLNMENVYSEIIVHTNRSNSNETGTDLGGFCGAIFSGSTVSFKKCVNAGIMSGPNGGLSGFFPYSDAADCDVTLEDCLVSGKILGPETQKKVYDGSGAVTGMGQVAGFVVKNKGKLTMKSCVMAAEINDYAYVYTYDNRTTSTYSGTSLLYVGDYEKVNGVVTNAGENDNKVVNTNATKCTLDNLKAVNSWAATQSIAGFSDWTATIEDGGIKMPITAELAATVKAFNAPEIDDSNSGIITPPAGDDGANNNATNDTTETTDTEAPETKKAAETTEAAEKKGCGGVIGAGAIAIVAVTGAALAIGAKKKED